MIYEKTPEERLLEAEKKLSEVKGFAKGLVNDQLAVDERNFQIYHAIMEILEGKNK